MPTSLIDECYRRAADARRLAEAASMPSNKVNFLGMEQRWLLAARSVTAKSSSGGQASKPVAQQTILNRPVAQQTIQVKEPKSQPAPRKGRPTKFTAERLQQINDLIAQGKSREEIAGLIGVTVGSLQVTCSKLGISLRRPRLNPQNELPGQIAPCSGTVISSPSQVTPVRFAFEQADQFLQSAQEAVPEAEAVALRPDESGKQKVPADSLALTMQYKGLQRASALDLNDDVLGQLIIEAQVRGMSVGQLVSALIRAAIDTQGTSKAPDAGNAAAEGNGLIG
jgi:transposase